MYNTQGIIMGLIIRKLMRFAIKGKSVFWRLICKVLKKFINMV